MSPTSKSLVPSSWLAAVPVADPGLDAQLPCNGSGREPIPPPSLVRRSPQLACVGYWLGGCPVRPARRRTGGKAQATPDSTPQAGLPTASRLRGVVKPACDVALASASAEQLAARRRRYS